MISETHINNTRLDIDASKRFYYIPNDTIRLTDIRCKNHLNSDNEYRSIPRMTHEPPTEDADGN